MRKNIVALIILFMMFLLPNQDAFASDKKDTTSMTYLFDLAVNGEKTVQVNTGDIITVSLKLQRTDSSDSYLMHGMQDELRYDSTFFEIVEDSFLSEYGITSKDIALTDNHREYYMNYLAMSEGTQWEKDTLVGSVQLRVIGTSGVSKITNQDYAVSWSDGSGSYECQANDVTVVLTTDCTVKFDSNGGSKVEDQIVQYGEKIVKPDDPVREGYKLKGWAVDIDQTSEWDFEKDFVESNMTLYAEWEEATTMNIMSYLWILLIVIIAYCIYKYKRAHTMN